MANTIVFTEALIMAGLSAFLVLRPNKAVEKTAAQILAVALMYTAVWIVRTKSKVDAYTVEIAVLLFALPAVMHAVRPMFRRKNR